MVAYLTGPLEKCNAIIQGAGKLGSDEVWVPYLCKGEDAFCPLVWKSATEEIYVLEV